jgi:hypothetical protein
MAMDLYCPNCGENLGKDTKNANPAYCSICGEDEIYNPRGCGEEKAPEVESEEDRTAPDCAVKVEGHVPDATFHNEGIHWISFRGQVNELAYPAFKEMPKLLRYQNRHYKKISFNSDTGWIHYKEVSCEEIAHEVK